MKRQEFIQIKGLDVKELKLKVTALSKEISDLTLDKNMKKIKDLKIVSKKKKELAQVLTVIRQKELLGQLESQVKHKESDEEVSKVKKEQNK